MTPGIRWGAASDGPVVSGGGWAAAAAWLVEEGGSLVPPRGVVARGVGGAVSAGWAPRTSAVQPLMVEYDSRVSLEPEDAKTPPTAAELTEAGLF